MGEGNTINPFVRFTYSLFRSPKKKITPKENTSPSHLFEILIERLKIKQDKTLKIYKENTTNDATTINASSIPLL
jgi:hypothetical protein